MLSKRFSSLYHPHLLSSLYCSTSTSSSFSSSQLKIDDITIVNGLPHVTVPLPSRNELCVFALKPISNTVGDFLDMLKQEDRGQSPERQSYSDLTQVFSRH